jgi:putative flippase GtrA
MKIGASKFGWMSSTPARFVIAGLPSLAIAVSLNLFLLKTLGWPGPLAYALVLTVQVVVNFILCVTFVFERDVQRSIVGQFLAYVSGSLLARTTEWIVYVGLTEWGGIPYLVAQLLNAVVFTLIKFSFVRRTIEGPPSV